MAPNTRGRRLSLTTEAPLILRPHKGPQEAFLSTPADIAIMGGAAGGGKTRALLMEPIRHVHIRDFRAVIFRRTSPQIMAGGGMWDEARLIYPHPPFSGEALLSPNPKYRFPRGAEISFAHLQHDDDRENWKGAQIALIMFDQLEEFTEAQFWYLLSRNRSVSGVRPYVRATCNPDASSWLAGFIAWWIDQDTGYAIPERSGVIRWLIRDGEEIHWGDTREELAARFPGNLPKSVTFIPALLEDNPTLERLDPGYRANLMALTPVERERLLKGNWKIMPSAGLYFRREWFEIVKAAPADLRYCRAWDLAASTKKQDDQDPDWTCGVKLGRARDGTLYVVDVARFRSSPETVKQAMKNLASADGKNCRIRIPQDPGQAGKAQVADLTKWLAGYPIRSKIVTGDKITRAAPVSSQCEAMNVKLVAGPWNEAFLTELQNFPKGAHDDQVDAFADAFEELVSAPNPVAVVA